MPTLGTMGTLSFDAVQNINLKLPTLKSVMVTPQGLGGHYEKITGYYPEPGSFTTVTFLTKNTDVQAFQATAFSYVKNGSLTLTLDDAMSGADIYTVYVKDVVVKANVSAVNDNVGDGKDTMVVCNWSVETIR